MIVMTKSINTIVQRMRPTRVPGTAALVTSATVAILIPRSLPSGVRAGHLATSHDVAATLLLICSPLPRYRRLCMVAVEPLDPEPVGGGDHPERHISARFVTISPKTAQSVGGCRGTGWRGNPASRAPPATSGLCM